MMRVVLFPLFLFFTVTNAAFIVPSSRIMTSTTSTSTSSLSFLVQYNSAVTTKTTTTSSSSSSTQLHLKRGGRPRGPLRTIEELPTMNDEIASEGFTEVRVVAPNPDGKGKDVVLGVMSTTEALEKAKNSDDNADLILINRNSDPPVCRLEEYTKYRYQRQKAQKEKKKSAKSSELKEVKMSYKIDVHDYEVRKKNAAKFALQGNRVKCTVQFRGREIQHDKLGFELLDKLAVDLEQICTMEGRPKRDGRNLSVMLSPKPEVVRAVNDKKRKSEKAKKKKRQESLESKQMEKEKMNEQQQQQLAAADKQAQEAAAAIALTLQDDDDDDDEDDDDDDNSPMSLEDLLGDDDIGDNLFGS